MAGKSQSMVFRFCDVPENVAGNFEAKCKHYPASISASTKSTSNLLIHLKIAIIAKARRMAPVPESNTTDEQQPAPKKRRGFFSALIDAPVHDV